MRVILNGYYTGANKGDDPIFLPVYWAVSATTAVPTSYLACLSLVQFNAAPILERSHDFLLQIS